MENKKIWTKEEKQLANEICDKINNDPNFRKWDGFMNCQGPKATPRYLEDERNNSK